MATHNDPDHHDVFPGGKAGVEIMRGAPVSRITVTQSDIDDVLRRAGLPLTEQVTQPPPPFGTEGFESYEGVIDPRAYLRPPLTVASSLLAQPLH